MFAKLNADKETQTTTKECKKEKNSKKREETELYFICYNEQNQLASILLMQSSSC
jgi:CRISPR/Cas system CSM-associated protein Csm4 (group 5 of RAMP superfamily)